MTRPSSVQAVTSRSSSGNVSLSMTRLWYRHAVNGLRGHKNMDWGMTTKHAFPVATFSPSIVLLFELGPGVLSQNPCAQTVITSYDTGDGGQRDQKQEGMACQSRPKEGGSGLCNTGKVHTWAAQPAVPLRSRIKFSQYHPEDVTPGQPSQEPAFGVLLVVEDGGCLAVHHTLGRSDNLPWASKKHASGQRRQEKCSRMSTAFILPSTSVLIEYAC